MQIRENVYERLTAKERFIAHIEAMARSDDDEIKRLVRTCPKKTYIMCDAECGDKIDALYTAAISVHADMLHYGMLYYFVLHDFEIHDEPHRIVNRIAQKIINIDAAWRAELAELGIAENIMHTVRPPRCFVLERILKLYKDTQSEPEGVKKERKVISQLLKVK